MEFTCNFMGKNVESNTPIAQSNLILKKHCCLAWKGIRLNLCGAMQDC